MIKQHRNPNPLNNPTIHGSIYDYLKEPENREIARIAGKMMQMILNKLHSTAING